VPDDIAARVRAALDRFEEAMQSLYKVWKLPRHYAPPPPASESDVASLEGLLGRPLPPSYRAFLLIQDGYPQMDGDTTAFSVKQMMAPENRDNVAVREKVARRAGDLDPGKLMVFGLSQGAESAFVFNLAEPGDEGEWPVVRYDVEEGITGRHSSFLHLVLDMTSEAEDEERKVATKPRFTEEDLERFLRNR
jgi:hypothetical protein